MRRVEATIVLRGDFVTVDNVTDDLISFARAIDPEVLSHVDIEFFNTED